MRRVIILVIVILVLSGILAFKILNQKNISPSQNMSREEVRQLLEKGAKVDNYIAKYTIEIDDERQDVTKIVKGNIIILETETMYTWQNLDTEERIIISYDKKTAIYSKESGIGTDISKSLPSQKDVISFMDDAEYEYSYIKEEKIEGIEYEVIELSCTYTTAGSSETDKEDVKSKAMIWINKDSGMVTKYETDVKNDMGEKSSTSFEYDIQINVVKDEDIKKPSLDGYEVIDIDKD